MVTRLMVAALIAVLGIPSSLFSQDPADVELAKGIREVQTGDFEGGVVTLDVATRRLSKLGGRARDLARAYLYLSIAYLGLSQEQKAKAQFPEAWKTDKMMEFSAREFPPKVLRFLEEARKDAVAADQVAANPVVTPTPKPVADPQPPQTAPEKHGKGGKALILLGVGGAAAAAVLAAAGASSGGSGSINPPPPEMTTRTFSGETAAQIPGTPPSETVGVVRKHSFTVSRAGTLNVRVVQGFDLEVFVCNGTPSLGLYCGPPVVEFYTFQTNVASGPVTVGEKTLFVYNQGFDPQPYVVELTFPK